MTKHEAAVPAYAAPPPSPDARKCSTGSTVQLLAYQGNVGAKSPRNTRFNDAPGRSTAASGQAIEAANEKRPLSCFLLSFGCLAVLMIIFAAIISLLSGRLNKLEASNAIQTKQLMDQLDTLSRRVVAAEATVRDKLNATDARAGLVEARVAAVEGAISATSTLTEAAMTRLMHQDERITAAQAEIEANAALLTNTSLQLDNVSGHLQAAVASLSHMESGAVNCAVGDLTAGNGSRFHSVSHAFARAYAHPPTVVWSVVQAEAAGDGDGNDFAAIIHDVTEKDFKLNCATYNSSQLKVLGVQWFAFGKEQ